MSSVLIELANAAGDRWAVWMLAASADAAILLAFVGLVWLAIRRRVAPQVGYCLFLMVPLKLLVPVSVAVPATVAQWSPAAWTRSWFDVGQRRAKTADASPADLLLPVAEKASIDQPIPVELGSATNSPAQPAPVESTPYAEARAPTESAAIRSRRLDPPGAVTAAPTLSFPATLMLAWLLGVLLLAGRLAITQWRFRAQMRRLTPLDDAPLAGDLRELCATAGIRQPVEIVASDAIAAPAVWGIVRPRIILPRVIVQSLSPEQLRWVLLHELAHVRRYDLLVLVVQRFVAILHFFNPTVWLANRMIHRLREYACDDLAISLADASPVASGEAFLKILQHVSHSPRGLEGALGVFGLDSRAVCLERIRRLLDTDRPLQTRSSRWAVLGLIVLALVALPHVRAANEAPKPGARGEEAKQAASVEKQAGDESQKSDGRPASGAASARRSVAGAPQQRAANDNTGAALAKDTKSFELHVVGPEGKPVPNATVEVRTSPKITAEQIVRGSFIRKHNYGIVATTDAEGALVISLPEMPKGFDINITTTGYGPYWAGWSSQHHAQPVPARFTAELEPAWSVGVLAVDEKGMAIEGVQIGPSIAFKKRPGDPTDLHVGVTPKTDAAGRWRFDSVPASKDDVFVTINHPDFMPLRRTLARSEFAIEPGGQPTAKIVLDRGLTVTGKVTDDAGNPIAGAMIHTQFFNTKRQTKTGDDGVYRLSACEQGLAKLVVSSKGRATDMLDVRIAPEMAPVNFRMAPGGKVRVRVLDHQGNPIAKARIFFQRWRTPTFGYFEFDHVNQYADEQGVWDWNEAPLDAFQADICGRGCMQLGAQYLSARAEEYVFRLPPELVITGKVVDAETREPVRKFEVIPGCHMRPGESYWFRDEQFKVENGGYAYRQTHDRDAYLIRIEAAGYRAAVSREIKSDEGNVTIDFELSKGDNIVAKIMTADLAPAAKAQVVLAVAGSQIALQNGEVRTGSTNRVPHESDKDGLVRLAPPDGDFQLIVLHPTGFAHVKSSSDWPTIKIIRLEPWARVEGTFRVGSKPAAGVPLTINTHRLLAFGNRNEPRIHTEYNANTAADGTFVFERVFPGKARIGRRIWNMVDVGTTEVTSAVLVSAQFPGGQTTRIDLGGSGKPVIGKLKFPDANDGKTPWSFGMVRVQGEPPPRPALNPPPLPAEFVGNPAQRAAWLEKWQETTAEGKIWKAAWAEHERLRDASPYVTASIAPDGSFRIDDMPEGNYELSVRFNRNEGLLLPNHAFAIPEIPGGRSDEPLDLGVLTLQGK